MEARLHEAAREGDWQFLKSMLEKINPPDLTLSLTPQKNTALHIAVAFGHEEIVRQMIYREPSLIFRSNSNGDTPLHIAAKVGNLSLMELLTALDFEEGTGWVADCAAALKMKNSDGYTPIHEALKKKHEEVASHLLGFLSAFDKDIKAVDVVSDAGESMLYLASEVGMFDVVRVMLESGNFSTRGPHGQNPLHIAVIRGHTGIVHHLMQYACHLIKEADDFGKTALHYASTIGYYDDDDERKRILERLMETEPSLAYKSDKDGNCPLLIATIEAPFAAVEIILKYCPDSAELVDRSGWNALHLAVLNNRVSTLGSLIKRPEFKMLINQPDNDRNTPMHLATQHHYHKIVELLLTCEGLDLAATNKDGLTAMDICGYTTKQRLIHDKLRRCGALPSRQLWRKMLLMPPPPPPPPPPRAPELVSITSNTEAVINTLSVVTDKRSHEETGEKKNHQQKESEISREAHEATLENHRGARENVSMGPSSPTPPNVDHMKRQAEKKNQHPKELEISREAHEDVLENHRGAREDVSMGPSSSSPPNVDVPAYENVV